MSERQADVVANTEEDAKRLGLIELDVRWCFCLTAYLEKGEIWEKKKRKYKDLKTVTCKIYNIIPDYSYTQCWLNGNPLLVYEDYALIHCHILGALYFLSTEQPASKLLHGNCCLRHLL